MIAGRHTGHIGAQGDHQDQRQRSQRGRQRDFEVGAELILHLAALGRAGGNGGVGDKAQVIAEHGAAHHGCHAQGQGEAGIGSHRHGNGHQQRDGTHAGTHGDGHEAGHHKQHGHSQLGRRHAQQEVGGSLGAGAAGHAHEDTGGHEDQDHGHDVLVAYAFCHQLQLAVKLDGAVLQTGHQDGGKEGHHDGDLIEAHLDFQYILEKNAQAQIQDQEYGDRQQSRRLRCGFVVHVAFLFLV